VKAGEKCKPQGSVASDATGSPLSCQSGKWTTSGGSGSSSTCPSGQAKVGDSCQRVALSCPSGQIWLNGTCSDPSQLVSPYSMGTWGTVYNGGPYCPPGFSRMIGGSNGVLFCTRS
jgi:hypothetical protein